MSALGRFHCILKFSRPSPNHFYDCQSIIGIKLVTRLRLGLSHLREHKFKHSFQDTLNPLCNCEMNVESSNYFLLQCFSNINERRTLMNTLNRINIQISQKSLHFWQTHSFWGINFIVTKRIHLYKNKWRYYWLHPINQNFWWTNVLSNVFFFFFHLFFDTSFFFSLDHA